MAGFGGARAAPLARGDPDRSSVTTSKAQLAPNGKLQLIQVAFDGPAQNKAVYALSTALIALLAKGIGFHVDESLT
jgi:hypothetical protein